MVNSQELRVGNFIYLEKEGKRKPYDISAHDIEEIEDFGEDAFPIQLTPELLTSVAGFKTSEGEVFRKSFFTIRPIMNITLSEALEGKDGDILYFRFKERTNIKYLHQLQNLYYFINNGEELEINFA